MRPGPKPKPTALRELDGNPGKRPYNESEPKPDIHIPDAPAWLSQRGRDEWDRITPVLEKLGLISDCDQTILAQYCNYVGRLGEAELMIEEQGPVLVGVQGGFYQNPWVAIANKCIEQIQKIGAEFGLTPSSRTRVSATPTDPATSNSPLLAFARQKLDQ